MKFVFWQKAARVVKPLLFPLVATLAILWFLIRVIPKPSRAAYPCQRAAAGIGGGFLLYLAAMIVPAALLRRWQGRVSRWRVPILAVSAAVLMAVALPTLVSQDRPDTAGDAFTPADLPNQPLGVARGIFPGRVVWMRDLKATSWDGENGFWWDDDNTSQPAVSNMLSASLRQLSGQPTDAAAWDALFRYANASRGLGDRGYAAGEKVVVKINGNQDFAKAWDNGGFQSPHLVYALVEQLIRAAGVAGADITLADASRYIGDPIHDKIRANPDLHFQSVRFEVRPDLSRNGRQAASPDFSHPIHFVKPAPDAADIPDHFPPTCCTEAQYIINLSLLRAHQLFGVTLSGKNHFGLVFNGSSFSPSLLHGFGTVAKPVNALGSPHCHPSLLGHEHLGGKTLLFLMDGLYTAVHQGSKTITRWQSLDNDYFSSLLLSQDPLALDSVALDFLRNEPAMRIEPMTVNTCNYLHESALAGSPPSGAVYDPEGDGTPLQSLGVHEHWDNAQDRRYSRNLGSGEGIELIQGSPSLVIVQPDGGERLNLGSRFPVAWRASSLSTPLKIMLWREGLLVGDIAVNLPPDSGSYLWKVAGTMAGSALPGTGYRIKIKAPGVATDGSAETFTIVHLRLLSPNGGEALAVGDVVPISWKAGGPLGPVKISLWRHGAWLGLIADKVDPAARVFLWPAGSYSGKVAPPGDGYSIRIHEKGTAILDNSDLSFSLL